jgi:hypothetical protein
MSPAPPPSSELGLGSSYLPGGRGPDRMSSFLSTVVMMLKDKGTGLTLSCPRPSKGGQPSYRGGGGGGILVDSAGPAGGGDRDGEGFGGGGGWLAGRQGAVILSLM